MSDMTDAEKAIVEKTPWPERAEDATADALIIHGARIAAGISAVNHELMVKAFAIDKEAPEYKPALGAWLDSTTAFIAEAQVVDLLVQVQEVSRHQADTIALRLWELTEDGGVLHELMWEYLADRGVDADEVFRLMGLSAKRAHGNGAEDV